MMSIFTYAKKTYPVNSVYRPLWSYRLKFIIRAVFYYKSFKHICTNIRPYLLDILCQRDPRFLEKTFRPYVINGISAIDRAKFVTHHFSFVSTLNPNIIDMIYRDLNGLMLFEFPIGNVNYSFKIKYLPRYQKEGDMSLVLCDEMNKNFYTLTFSLRYMNGYRQLIVGGLQGPASSIENNLKIKILTKALYGQRPKDLMIKIIAIIANVWQVDTLLAINNRHHAYSAKRYAKGKIKMDYDQHWMALGGSEFDCSLYALPLDDIRRNFEDIPRTKRAMYRRRYEWLDNTKILIEKKLK